MRRGVVAPLTLALVISSVGSVTGAQPDPSEPLASPGVRRVESVADGIALSVPEAWASLPGAMLPDLVVAGFASAEGNCAVVRIPASDPRATDDILDGLVRTGYWASLPGGYVRDSVQIPAGEAIRVTFDEEQAVTGSTFLNVLYFVLLGDSIFTLQCAAEGGVHAPPDDRWLSVAVTLEPLPQSAGASPPPSVRQGSGRIRRSAEGFAITFPDAWEITDVPAGFSDQQPEVEDESGSRGRVRWVLFAADPDTDAQCHLTDFTEVANASPPWISVEAAVAARLARFDPRYVADASATYVALPAGQTGRIDSALVNGWEESRYYFSDGTAWFSLACRASDAPPDRWLSIAKSFEFLPAAE